MIQSRFKGISNELMSMMLFWHLPLNHGGSSWLFPRSFCSHFSFGIFICMLKNIDSRKPQTKYPAVWNPDLYFLSNLLLKERMKPILRFFPVKSWLFLWSVEKADEAVADCLESVHRALQPLAFLLFRVSRLLSRKSLWNFSAVDELCSCPFQVAASL